MQRKCIGIYNIIANKCYCTIYLNIDLKRDSLTLYFQDDIFTGYHSECMRRISFSFCKGLFLPFYCIPLSPVNSINSGE